MGIVSHHTIVVTATYGDWAKEAHLKAVSIFGDGVSPLSPKSINATESFCVWPDGSKEGWSESDEGDAKRNKFIEWLGAQRYGDGSTPYCWAEVEMGECGSPRGDREGASVRRHYWKDIRLERYSGPATLAIPPRPLPPSGGNRPTKTTNGDE